MSNITEKIASIHLGKKSKGSKFYDSSLLVAVPREENRMQYNIKNENLPFIGWDVWHAYEFSSMTENGIPFTRVLKLKYNCNNNFLIESKSLKLYLNSFNMSRFGKTIDEALIIIKDLIKNDLSKILKTDVEISFLNQTTQTNLYDKFKNIMDFVDVTKINIDKFKESPEYLQIKKEKKVSKYFLRFDSLRSNCRVTHQPDFGQAFIYYKSNKHIDETSLVKYLTSFRSEYHFHEECCEMIFKRLQDLIGIEADLFVGALYTRRGGIDICPTRWSKSCRPEFVHALLDTEKYATFGFQF